MPDAAVRIDTLSVLFTDLVSSTELRVRLGEAGADDLRRVHDALLAEAVGANNGTVVKGLGDGLMVTFPSAADAVAGAIAVQQATCEHRRRVPAQAFEVRVGISLGDVSIEDGDAFGVPVVEAARLCGVAAAGEILAADLVRALARSRTTTPFEPMGDLELKGLPAPVTACRVVWEPLAAMADEAIDHGVPVPNQLVGAVTTYIGRPELRARLTELSQGARQGACRTVLLAGEPGVGKTRTASEVARQAFSDGAIVLYGPCDEDLAVPYQPFVEALGHYSRHAATPELGRLAGELQRLDPQLAQLVPGLPEAVPADPATEEHRLFEAVASWLVAVARSTSAGLVLVLDDLHWATKPTLLLLQHVVRHAGTEAAPLLVLGTYRDTDIDRAHPLAAALADLRRIEGTERIAVDNLTDLEVVGFIEAAAGHDLDTDSHQLALLVHAETEGNPFFVGEVMRHLIETGGVRREGERWVVTTPGHVAIPEGVRDVVGRRLTRLTETANEVLSTAAVYGRDFEVDPLLAMVACGDDDALDALDEAVRARLVEETGPDRYRFSHALVRTTLYEELSATRRRRLHRRVAEILEKLRPHDVTALAHHCTEAGPDRGDISRALHYTLAAAEAALAARAFADAEAQFRNALELAGDDDHDPDTQRLLLTAACGLGEAQRDQGNPEFRQTLLDATRRALSLGDFPLTQRAALANSRGYFSAVSELDHDRIELLEQALAATVGCGESTRALLLAQLAVELNFTPDHAVRFGLTDEAVAIAREIGDPDLLARVLTSTAYAGWSSSRLELQHARNQEAVSITAGGGDPAVRVLALIWLSASSLALGDVRSSIRTIDQAVIFAEIEATPSLLWFARYNQQRSLAIRCQLGKADDANNRLLEEGSARGEPDVMQFWQAAAAMTVWARGHAGLLADAMGAHADQYPDSPTWRSAHIWFLACAGRLAEARAVLATHPHDPVEALDAPFAFTPVTHLGFVAWLLEDTWLAARMVEALTPHVGCWSHYQTGCNGPVAWALGLSRSIVGDPDGALDDLEVALADVMEQDARVFAPHIRRDLAIVLRRRDRAGDAERAHELLTTALQEATEFALDGVVAEITGLLDLPDPALAAG